MPTTLPPRVTPRRLRSAPRLWIFAFLLAIAQGQAIAFRDALGRSASALEDVAGP